MAKYSGEVRVTRQVLVTFAIGRYKDEVLYDVVSMQTGHILFGRPWQFDRRAIHDGYKDTYSFENDGVKICLKPFTPFQVYQDQVKMKEKELENKRRT